VELGGYTGAAGQEIAVLASDSVAVAGVEIEIRGIWDAVLEACSAH
jgi:hypothetical protein